MHYSQNIVILKYTTLKNLSSIYEVLGRSEESIFCAKALDVDDRDVVEWYRLGHAKYVLQQGLERSYAHWLSLANLLSVHNRMVSVKMADQIIQEMSGGHQINQPQTTSPWGTTHNSSNYWSHWFLD